MYLLVFWWQGLGHKHNSHDTLRTPEWAPRRLVLSTHSPFLRDCGHGMYHIKMADNRKQLEKQRVELLCSP